MTSAEIDAELLRLYRERKALLALSCENCSHPRGAHLISTGCADLVNTPYVGDICGCRQFTTADNTWMPTDAQVTFVARCYDDMRVAARTVLLQDHAIRELRIENAQLLARLRQGA